MRETDFLVIGAGMAGTSCAYWLAENHSVRLLEMEAQPGYHTTGRSIAVYTEAYGPRTVRALAKAGFEFLTRPSAEFSPVPLSKPHAWIFVAREDQRDALGAALDEVHELSPQIREISASEAVEMVPVLRQDYLAAALYEPTTLALDVSAIHQGFIGGLKKRGGEIVCNAEAMEFERKGGKWHVRSQAGEFVASVVVNAAGAWADVIARRIGARPIGLQPKRRTVIAFKPDNVRVDNNWPIVIDVDEEFYFKIDAGTVLGSPADETPVPAQDIQPEQYDIALAADRIERATTMKIGKLERTWAGLRSFVADDVPVVGYDPDVDGFFWCAGQGGYGIETSYGIGRSTAWLATGRGIPDDISSLGVSEAALSPERLR